MDVNATGKARVARARFWDTTDISVRVGRVFIGRIWKVTFARRNLRQSGNVYGSRYACVCESIPGGDLKRETSHAEQLLYPSREYDGFRGGFLVHRHS